MPHFEIFRDVHQALAAARLRDRFAARGRLSIAINGGQAQVQRIIRDPAGWAFITHASAFMALDCVAGALMHEALFGELR